MRSAPRAGDAAGPVAGLPAAVSAAAVLGTGLLVLPVAALLWRVNWASVPEALGSSSTAAALRLSAVTSLSAAAIAGLAGVPLGWVLARSSGRWARPLRAAVLLPLVLPPVVAGVALLAAFGRNGLLGAPLEAIGITLPFTTPGVVVAQAFVAAPFVVLSVEAGVRTLDPALEEAAAACGAGRWMRLRAVSLPLVAPSILAGVVLGWARAVGEFGATLTFAGSLEGRTRTLPLEVVNALEVDPDVALAVSVVLLVVSFAVLVALRERWWPQR